ncbi:MAG: hypothetical protein AB7O56_06060 [Bauldia sp.]
MKTPVADGDALMPLMVDKATAAALCSMCVATYDRYAKLGLLPPMNATGRVSTAVLLQSVLKLDGVERSSRFDPDAALEAWRSSRGAG